MTPNDPAAATSRTSVSTKIFLIVAIFSLPIGVLAYLLAANYTPQIETAQLELSGNAIQKPLMSAIFSLMIGRNILQGCDTGACGPELSRNVAPMTASLDAASAQDAHLGGDLKTTVNDLAKKGHKDLALDNLQAEWKTLAAASSNVSTPAARADLAIGYEHLAGQLKQLVSYIGDTSNLILDPDLDSYYLVDVTLLAMPDAVTQIATAASIGNKLISGSGTIVDQAALVNESALLQQSIDRIAASNHTTFDADAANHGVSPTLQPKLGPALKQYSSSIASYLTTLKALGANPSQITPAAFAGQVEAAQNASLDYWKTGASELDALLYMRIVDFETGRVQALGFSAMAVIMAALIAFILGRSITRPLRELVRNLAPGATLLGVSVERIAEASQSKTPSQEEAQIICEELNAHAENMRSAVLELARHVEGSAAASRMVQETAGQAKD
jgi:methyl-accepting chemotaxis protein